MKQMIYPLTPRKMDERDREMDEINSNCGKCNTPIYLQNEYCSIGICVKEQIKHRREE